jgi:hypothetical protein
MVVIVSLLSYRGRGALPPGVHRFGYPVNTKSFAATIV